MQQKYPQVIEDCTKAITLNEGYTDAYLLRAEAYQAQGNLQQAREDIKKAEESTGSLAPHEKGQPVIDPIF